MKQHYRTHVALDARLVGVGEAHAAIARALLQRFTDDAGPVLIAVGGPGGIGKTTFARNLAQALQHAVVLGLDDYKKSREERRKKSLFGPHPEANEMELIGEHLRQLARGETIEKPIYCREQGAIRTCEPFSPARFVIVEGEVATYACFFQRFAFSIFIDSHWRTQLNTRIERDIEQRGYTPEKAIATFLHSNLREFGEYGAESKHWADVHIHCGADYALTIDAVCAESSGFFRL